MKFLPQWWLQWKCGRTMGGRREMHRRIAGLLLLLLTLLHVPEAWGAIRHVSKLGTDNPTCAPAAACRSIQHAVSIAGNGDWIIIGNGKFHENGGVIIDKDLTLFGGGIFSTRVVSAWPGFSIFHVESGATVMISDLDIMGGDAERGGGILNEGNLTLNRVRLWKNRAKQGGGIFNTGSLKIYRSEIAHNTASDSGGGLYNENFTVLHQVRIVVNHANRGKSGGIENKTPGGFPLVQAEYSEISHNDGNGIINRGNMSLINTTVSRNKQAGIFVADGFFTELVHATVAENDGGGLHLLAASGNDISLGNTIVANNAVAQCSVSGGSVLAVVDAIGSLFSDGSCGPFWSGTNLVGVDPKLGPLKWNGGFTFTHALKKGSPAIDAGSPDYCEAADQRDISRLIDGNGDGVVNCDIGAYEYLFISKIPLEQ